ncbi:hypothetical protein TMatcc_004318 [Talaromyces marneffei ATCC 18224]
MDRSLPEYSEPLHTTIRYESQLDMGKHPLIIAACCKFRSLKHVLCISLSLFVAIQQLNPTRMLIRRILFLVLGCYKTMNANFTREIATEILCVNHNLADCSWQSESENGPVDMSWCAAASRLPAIAHILSATW